MEKKPQILNLRKQEPEARLPIQEVMRVVPKEEPAPTKVLSAEHSLAPVSEDLQLAPHQVPISKERSWGFMIKQKSLHSKKLIFVIAGVLLVGALAWVVSPNIPLLMVVGLSVGVIMIKAYVPRKDTKVVFSDRGIQVNEAFYSSATLASFHIDETEVEFPELSFELKRHLMPRLKIPIPQHLVPRVRNSLSFMALEMEHEPSFGEMLGKKIGL